jgi:hypothetical protein
MIVLDIFDYGFAENGLMAFKEGKLFAKKVNTQQHTYLPPLLTVCAHDTICNIFKSIADEIPNDKFKEFINSVLLYLATEVDCPVKR